MSSSNEALRQAARDWTAANYPHCQVTSIMLTLSDGRGVERVRMPVYLGVPPAPLPPATSDRALQSAERYPPPSHSPDYSSVTCRGETYSFTPMQAAVVRTLWEAGAEMRQETILDRAGSEGSRLRNIFQISDGAMHSAWGDLVIPGGSRGAYRLDLSVE